MPYFCLLAFLIMVPGWALADQAPLNDDFTNRFVLTGTSVVSEGTLKGSTLMPYEQPSACAFSSTGHAPGSVWWSWVAPGTGPVILQLRDIKQNFGGVATIAVINPVDGFTNFPLQGDPVTNVLCFAFESVISGAWATFNASAGRTYYIQAAGGTEASFKLSLVMTNAPMLYSEPADLTVTAGQSALFTVRAAGIKPMSFQWWFNGTNLLSSIGPSLALTNLTAADAGGYSVVVTDSMGVCTSRTALLNVTLSDSSPHLSVGWGTHSNTLSFSVGGDVGRYYRIETSSNLVQWTVASNFPYILNERVQWLTSVVFSSNGLASFELPMGAARSFWRAARYTPSNEVCNVNLKQIRFGKTLWAIEGRHGFHDTPWDQELFLFPTSVLRVDRPRCPDGGLYSLSYVGDEPICTFHGHVLEEPPQ